MPCYSEPPSSTELEFYRLNDLVREIGGTPNRSVWDRKALDGLTRQLCAWCKANDPRKASLELQIWWRDHQKWDRERQDREASEQREMELRKSALKKLTAAEKKALGLK